MFRSSSCSAAYLYVDKIETYIPMLYISGLQQILVAHGPGQDLVRCYHRGAGGGTRRELRSGRVDLPGTGVCHNAPAHVLEMADGRLQEIPGG